MSRVILGVTGSVAAIKTPSLFRELISAGHEVRVVATTPALHFFDPNDFGPQTADGGPLFQDTDEWPEARWTRNDPVLHIEFRNWADVLILAPLDANTLGKVAFGLCDNFLTCLVRAWNFGSKSVILAPAMNTQMWINPATKRHLRMLLEDHGDNLHPNDWTLETVDTIFAKHAPRLVLVPPQSKRLACGDFGVGAMAEVVTIAETVRSSQASPVA